ncbi:MAG: galactose mutarotase [bacterium]|nr:galactose mutarotase [bacterium]
MRIAGYAMLCCVLLAGLASCARVANAITPEAKPVKKEGTMSIHEEKYGKTPDGQEAKLYTLTNAAGMEVKITNFGAIVVSVRVPDREGRFEDVTLGFDDLPGWIDGTSYFGCVVGRYGNRIAQGRFALDGEAYTLAVNNGPNHLHGGLKGFDKKLWAAESFTQPDGVGVKLRCVSPDGEEGYPGTLKASVVYVLSEDNELKVLYDAETDKATPINLTQHTYFNLAGPGTRDILEHVLMLNADKFTPVDKTLIPTGVLQPVAGTPFDFTAPAAIGARIGETDQQLEFGGGYDHNFVLNSQDGTLALAARVHAPGSGRVMEVYTTEPGVQFYCGNFLDGSTTGKGGKVYEYRYGFCLETQHYPDSPNQPDFPSCILRPGERYKHETVFKFLTDAAK